MEVNIHTVVLCIVRPWSLVGGHLYAENAGSVILQDVGNQLPDSAVH